MKKVQFNPKGNLGKLLTKLQKLNKQKIEVGYFAEQQLHATGDSYANIMKVNYNGWQIMNLVSNAIKADIRKGSGTLARELNQLVHSNQEPTKFLMDLGNTYAHYSINYFGNDQFLVVTYNPTPMVDTGELADNFAWRTSLTMQYKTVG